MRRAGQRTPLLLTRPRRSRPGRVGFGWGGSGRPCLALGLLLAACGPRVLAEPVVETEDYRVLLRHTEDDGETVKRDYTHPATVSDVRLAHILANLEHQDSEGRRRPTIRSATVYPLAEALNKAIQKAGPSDEVAAVLYETDRRLGLFNLRKVTSFRLFFRDDTLVMEFFDVERELEPGEGKPGRRDTYEIPGETPAAAPAFKLLAGEARFTDGPRTIQVAWRDPFYANPVSLSVRGDRFRRRTVLMESPEEEAAPPAGPEEPTGAPAAGLSAEQRDAQIRALDQLDALRRQGLVKEVEYQRRRRLIIEGRLEEAGYDPSAP